jgi:hypothetical protein
LYDFAAPLCGDLSCSPQGQNKEKHCFPLYSHNYALIEASQEHEERYPLSFQISSLCGFAAENLKAGS